MQGNYQQIIERISRLSGIEKEELDRRVEAKRAKLSGLISKEGAAQVIAAELGINFDKEKIKINELLSGMKRVNVTGKIIQMFPVREYKKENREGKIASFILADETGNIRVVLWDTNHIALIENNKIKENSIIEITNASIRNMEMHLTGFSDIKLSNEKLENVIIARTSSEEKIVNLKSGQSAMTRAIVVQIFEPKFFEICPECKSKVVQEVEGTICETHGKVIPLKRALTSFVLDDGTETIRAVLFSEQIGKMFTEEELNNAEMFLIKRQDILGKEYFFSGMIRQNKIFNNLELHIEDIKEPEIEELIASLEK